MIVVYPPARTADAGWPRACPAAARRHRGGLAVASGGSGGGG